MSGELPLKFPMKVKLYKDGRLYREFIARKEFDLRCRVEMMTGIGWLNAAGLYQEMLDRGSGRISDTFRVCHSYEKWGAMQQEVIEIEARLRRMSKWEIWK